MANSSSVLGDASALPAPADYDGDGVCDLAVYWPDRNLWRVRRSSDGVLVDRTFGILKGRPIPVPGYYDADAQCDPATLQVSGDFLIWCVQRSGDYNPNGTAYRGQSYQFSTGAWRVSW